MIRSPHILEPDHVPRDELQSREGALDTLQACLRPIEESRSGMDALLTGPPGAGKTTLARFMMAELERECPGVATAVLDCWDASSQMDALYQLLQELNRASFPRSAGSTGRCLDVLRDHDGDVVVLVDEVDLVPEALIPSLYQLSHVTVLMACVDEDTLLSGLDRRVAERIRTARHIRLDKYSQHALEEIVRARADAALTPGAVDSETVREVAARSEGNARMAIMLLREAAELASREGETKLTKEVVARVQDDAARSAREHNRSRWGEHRWLLWDIIREHEELHSSDLHSAYEARADDPLDKSQRRRHLASLVEYGEIDKQGATSNRTYFIVED